MPDGKRYSAVLITYGWPPYRLDGPAKMAKDLAHTLTDIGFSVTVHTSGPRAEVRTEGGIRVVVHREGGSGSRLSLMKYRLTTFPKQVGDSIKARAAPDLFVAMDVLSQGALAATLASSTGARCIGTVFGQTDRERSARMSTLKGFKRFIYWLGDKRQDRDYRICRKELDRAIIYTEGMAESLARWKFPKDKVRFVRLGFDTTEFSPGTIVQERMGELKQAYGITTRYVLWVGAFRVADCPLETVQIFKQIAERFDDVDLLMLGDGELREELERAVERAELGERIHLLGRVPHSDIKYFYSGADLFISPMVLPQEGVGWPIMEAMAMETPVIVTDVGPLMRELVDDGVNGFVVQPDDWGAMSERAAWLIENVEESAEMGARAREAVLRIYSYDAEREDWKNVLTELGFNLD